MRAVILLGMTDFADAQAHNSIPDEFLQCLMTRRHSFPLRAGVETKVRIQFGDDKRDVLDLFESVGDCTQCGTTRILWRDQLTNRFVSAEYKRPDGYDAPPGRKWDRDLLWSVYRDRHPVQGRTRVVKR